MYSDREVVRPTSKKLCELCDYPQSKHKWIRLNEDGYVVVCSRREYGE
jgi:hypothetical protein